MLKQLVAKQLIALLMSTHLNFNLAAHAIVHNVRGLQHESPQHQPLAFAPAYKTITTTVTDQITVITM
jgi:hypothetical protein